VGGGLCLTPRSSRLAFAALRRAAERWRYAHCVRVDRVRGAMVGVAMKVGSIVGGDGRFASAVMRWRSTIGPGSRSGSDQSRRGKGRGCFLTTQPEARWGVLSMVALSCWGRGGGWRQRPRARGVGRTVWPITSQ
jgi:hypothetical protein